MIPPPPPPPPPSIPLSAVAIAPITFPSYQDQAGMATSVSGRNLAISPNHPSLEPATRPSLSNNNNHPLANIYQPSLNNIGSFIPSASSIGSGGSGIDSADRNYNNNLTQSFGPTSTSNTAVAPAAAPNSNLSIGSASGSAIGPLPFHSVSPPAAAAAAPPPAPAPAGGSSKYKFLVELNRKNYILPFEKTASVLDLKKAIIKFYSAKESQLANNEFELKTKDGCYLFESLLLNEIFEDADSFQVSVEFGNSLQPNTSSGSTTSATAADANNAGKASTAPAAEPPTSTATLPENSTSFSAAAAAAAAPLLAYSSDESTPITTNANDANPFPQQ